MDYIEPTGTASWPCKRFEPYRGSHYCARCGYSQQAHETLEQRRERLVRAIDAADVSLSRGHWDDAYIRLDALLNALSPVERAFVENGASSPHFLGQDIDEPGVPWWRPRQPPTKEEPF